MSKPKVSSAQAAQLSFLDTLTPKFDRIHRLIEEVATFRGTDTLKSLCRILDELRNGAAALTLNALGDTFAMMAAVARRSGGHQMKIRALREGLISLKTNLEGSRKAALKGAPAQAAPDADVTSSASPPERSP